MNTHSTRYTGAAGEQAVADFLDNLGLQILQRNYYCRYGEIDIVAVDDGMIVFIEVKSTTLQTGILPTELLNPRKLRRLERSIGCWLLANRYEGREWRFDFVGVILDHKGQPVSIEHIPHAEI